MVSGRPFLYLSLPGVAFILGVFWFRRRNKNRIVGKDTSCPDKDSGILNKESKEELTEKINANIYQNMPVQHTTSQSMHINSNVFVEDDSVTTKHFGKSAPIQIVQSGRGSPAKHTKNQQIDTEVLKIKIQDVEHKVLRSIDEDFENLSSPIDLPDSLNNHVTFYARNVNIRKDEPIVIKATITPKISPENSFLESTYTVECEHKNSYDLNEPTVEKNHLKRKANQQDQSQLGKEIDSNDEEKRNVDAASPSLSLCSVQSGDSGKGSSLPRSEATRGKTSYEFFFPYSLIGHLYGRHRSYINQIKIKTSANVVIKKTRVAGKVRICAIEGTENQINSALMMIRQRLPAKRYPNFTMQRIHFALPQTIVPLSTESLFNLQLHLIEGINNDVVVSAVITGGHIFVQHPLHPSHPSLAVLQKCIFESYTATEAPMLPGIELSAVCVVAVNSIWYRVQIVEVDAQDDQRCLVKFLDFGGYMNVNLNELRQIRSDFMGVPFQATECILSNIETTGSSLLPEAADILCRLSKGIVLQAQVAGYNSHNIPEIYLFAYLGPNNVIFINKELVARNLAKWVDVRD